MLKRAASAGLWATFEALAGQGIALLVYLVLARLLLPAEFGLFAIAVFFSSLAAAGVGNGLSNALVQRKDTGLQEESTVFWAALGLSVVVAAILAAASGPLAGFYELPELRSLILAVACQIVILSLSIVPSALLVRRLEFATLTKIGAVSATVAGAIAIIAASLGAGVWALAAQVLVSASMTAYLTYRLSGWRPGLQFDLSSGAPVFKFASWVSLSGMLEIVYAQGAGLIIGKAYGSRDLGFFDRARTINLLPVTFMAGIIGRIALPLFSQSSLDEAGLRDAMRRALGFSMLVFLPPVLALVTLPDLVVQVLVGNNWLPAAPILAILALSSILLPLHAINLQLLLAKGRADLFFRLEIVKKLLGIACIAIGVSYGITGLAWGYVAANILALPLNTWPTGRSIGYGMARQLADLAGLALCGLAMAACMIWLRGLVDLPPLAELLVLGVSGLGAFLVVGLTLRLRAFRDAFEIVRVLLDRRAGNPGGETENRG